MDAETICSSSREDMQSIGLSFRKVDYIKDFAEKVKHGEFDIEKLKLMEDMR